MIGCLGDGWTPNRRNNAYNPPPTRHPQLGAALWASGSRQEGEQASDVHPTPHPGPCFARLQASAWAKSVRLLYYTLRGPHTYLPCSPPTPKDPPPLACRYSRTRLCSSPALQVSTADQLRPQPPPRSSLVFLRLARRPSVRLPKLYQHRWHRLLCIRDVDLPISAVFAAKTTIHQLPRPRYR